MLSRKRQLRRFRRPGGAPAAIALTACCLFVLVVLTPGYPARAQEEGRIINEASDFFGADAGASVNLFNGFEKSLRSGARGSKKRPAASAWSAHARTSCFR